MNKTNQYDEIDNFSEILLDNLKNKPKKIKKQSSLQKSIQAYNKKLFLAFIILIIMLGFSVPKIFLSNSIYKISKNIDTLYGRYHLLKEENKILNQKIQILKYKKDILKNIEYKK